MKYRRAASALFVISFVCTSIYSSRYRFACKYLFIWRCIRTFLYRFYFRFCLCYIIQKKMCVFFGKSFKLWLINPFIMNARIVRDSKVLFSKCIDLIILNTYMIERKFGTVNRYYLSMVCYFVQKCHQT